MVRKSANLNNNIEKEEPEELSKDRTCGLFNWRPKYLQVFTDPRFFVLNFSIIAVIQGTYFSYLIGCSSTLEKRFSYSSRLTGFILIADNFSQILISPFVGFLGKRMNKATLIAGGMVFVSFSCWLTALPYFIYGPATHLLTETEPSTLGKAKYLTNRTIEFCDASGGLHCDSNDSITVWPAYFIIWMASFLNGVGYTAFYTLGFPYVDDNIPKHNAPIYFSIVAALRLLGPTSGFLLVSFCLSYYENPFLDVNLAKTDPRFVGAWWIGFLIIGSAIFLVSLPLFLFPRNLKTARVKAKADFIDDVQGKGVIAKLKEAKVSLGRILTNPLYVFDVSASIVRMIGYAGFYITQPKYIESQFKKSASSASFATGMYSVLSMAFGIVAGGIFIRFAKPGPRALTACIFVVELFAQAGIFSGLFFGCPKAEFFAVNNNLMDPCNNDCHCSRQVLQPYCSSDGKTNYFSPCFAGCQSSPLFTSNGTLDNCMCDTTRGLTSAALTPGYCETDCGNNFTKYITFLSIGKFIASTARTGNLIVRVRSVEERDKSFAMGISMTVSGILAYIPYPLIFGAVADAACAIWEESCSGRGNCWLYDSDKFRNYLHMTAFFFMSIGSIFDIFVIFFSKRMQNLYADDEDKPEEITMEPTQQSSN